VINFAEYALNGNPTNAADHGGVDGRTDGEELELIYAKLMNNTNVIYRLIDSTNLTGGVRTTNGYRSMTEGSVIGSYRFVTNVYDLTSDTLFVTLQVEAL